MSKVVVGGPGGGQVADQGPGGFDQPGTQADPARGLAVQARTLARLARVLERAASPLTLPQYRVLGHLVEGQSRASAIAGQLALTKPAVSAVVDALVAGGLVVREDVAGDRRAISLVATPAGRSALAVADAAYAEVLGEVVAQLPGGSGGASARRLASVLAELDQVLARRRAARRAGSGAGEHGSAEDGR